MEFLFSQFTTLTGMLGVIVIGLMAVIGMWDKASKIRREKIQQEETRLISALEKNVENLQKKADEQARSIKEFKEKLDKLSAENKALIDIIQGRDENTKKLIEQVVEAIKKTHENNTLIREVYENEKKTKEIVKEVLSIIKE